MRITEALAKLTLSPVATEQHVDEAIRLFLGSTMDAVLSQGGDSARGSGLSSNRELMDEVSKVEEGIRKRLPIGWSISVSKLRQDIVDSKGFSEQSLDRALYALTRRETVQFRRGGAMVYRSGV